MLLFSFYIFILFMQILVLKQTDIDRIMIVVVVVDWFLVFNGLCIETKSISSSLPKRGRKKRKMGTKGVKHSNIPIPHLLQA